MCWSCFGGFHNTFAFVLYIDLKLQLHLNSRCCRNRMCEITVQKKLRKHHVNSVKKRKCLVSVINKSRRHHFHESLRGRGSKYFPANPSVFAYARPLPPSASPLISCSLSIPTAVWWEDQGLQRGWVPKGEYQPQRSAQRQPPARLKLMSLGTWLQRKQPAEETQRRPCLAARHSRRPEVMICCDFYLKCVWI